MKIAVFPGSFDPITNGHIEIINRITPLFDKIIIAIGIHQEKNYYFSLDQRMGFIKNAIKGTNIEVDHYQGLTSEYCLRVNSQYIIRGIRNGIDFEYEKDIAQTNKELFNIETLFLISDPNTTFISSSIVRDILKNGGDISKLVPKSVISI